jgi:hypothetical protein
MSFQYNTKTLEELQEISKIIVDNFAPLVGCKQNSKLWSPPVGFGIATKLSISGFECTNLAKDSIDMGYIEESKEYRSPILSPLSYSFDTTVTELAKTIWDGCKKLSNDVLDTSYFSTLKINLALSSSEKMRQCVLNCTEYNSTIYSAIAGNKTFSYTVNSRQLYLILLQTFSVRYALYDFAMSIESSIDSTAINKTMIETLIKNCEYEKYVLSQLDLECYNYDVSPTYMQQQLSLIIKNCKQLKTYVMAYINL